MKGYLNFLALLILFACDDRTMNREIDAEYLQRYNEFVSGSPKGRRLFYLQLVGMVELDPMKSNTFGTDSLTDHTLNIVGFPKNAGAIKITGDSIVYFKPAGLNVSADEESVGESHWMQLKPSGQSSSLQQGEFKWFITAFGGKHYLRILDTSSDQITQFKGFDRFEPVSEFIIPGKVNRYDQPREVSVPTVFDFEEKTTFVGTVDFEYKGEQYSLQMEKGGFIMFSDGTSGDTTYGAGRYLRIRRPKEDGTTMIDFNYAFNPPCSFSDYTTCLFPPSSNSLPFKVLAGEKAQML